MPSFINLIFIICNKIFNTDLFSYVARDVVRRRDKGEGKATIFVVKNYLEHVVKHNLGFSGNATAVEEGAEQSSQN